MSKLIININKYAFTHTDLTVFDNTLRFLKTIRFTRNNDCDYKLIHYEVFDKPFIEIDTISGIINIEDISDNELKNFIINKRSGFDYYSVFDNKKAQDQLNLIKIRLKFNIKISKDLFAKLLISLVDDFDDKTNICNYLYLMNYFKNLII